MNNLEIVTAKFEQVLTDAKTNKTSKKITVLNQAVKNLIASYTNEVEKLNKLSTEVLENHNYTTEVHKEYYRIEKSKKVVKLLKNALKIETHTYAPELNKVIFKGIKSTFEFSTPQITTFENLEKFLNRLDVEKIEELQQKVRRF